MTKGSRCGIAAVALLGLAPAMAGIAQNSAPTAQPAPTNHVLELDGTNSYVQLPDDMFQGFTQGTVEAWIYPYDWNSIQRFFNFGGFTHDMGVGRPDDANSGLEFFISAIRIGLSKVAVFVETPVPARRWLHLAAVSGPGGMELYLNGGLLGKNLFPGSFNRVSGKPNLIGAWHLSHNTGLGSFAGRIGEFRVWKTRRSVEQIRENMFRHLTGKEPDLAGLWNFDQVENGVVKDLTAGAHDGKLMGNAKIVVADTPASFSPVRLSTALELDGKGSFAELPSDLFTNLAEATVEGWVKWSRLGTWGRFFDLGKPATGREIDITQDGDSGSLEVELGTAGGEFQNIEVPAGLRTNQWQHYALVLGKDQTVLLTSTRWCKPWQPLPPPREQLAKK